MCYNMLFEIVAIHRSVEWYHAFFDTGTGKQALHKYIGIFMSSLGLLLSDRNLFH